MRKPNARNDQSENVVNHPSASGSDYDIICTQRLAQTHTHRKTLKKADKLSNRHTHIHIDTPTQTVSNRQTRTLSQRHSKNKERQSHPIKTLTDSLAKTDSHIWTDIQRLTASNGDTNSDSHNERQRETTDIPRHTQAHSYTHPYTLFFLYKKLFIRNLYSSQKKVS